MHLKKNYQLKILKSQIIVQILNKIDRIITNSIHKKLKNFNNFIYFSKKIVNNISINELIIITILNRSLKFQ